MMSVLLAALERRERHAPPSGVIEGWAQLSPIQPSTVSGRGKAGLLALGPGGGGVPSPRSGGTFSCLDHLATEL